MKLATATATFLAIASTASAWQLTIEKEPDGRVFRVAEQPGDGGNFLNLVCHEGKVHIEIIVTTRVPAISDTAEVMQVDGRAEHLVAGFVEEIDPRTSVFVGVDRRDQPAASTEALLREMAAGNALFWGDPDNGEAVERWSMRGATKALAMVREGC